MDYRKSVWPVEAGIPERGTVHSIFVDQEDKQTCCLILLTLLVKLFQLIAC